MDMFCVLVISLIIAYSGAFVIDLSTYDPTNKTTHVFRLPVNLTEDISQITVIKNEVFVEFYIIQAHSYIYNVTLSKSVLFEKKNSIDGTNVGLVQFNENSNIDQFYIKRLGKVNNRVLLVVTMYQHKDPVPGGCNMVFDNEIAPYQRILNSDEMFMVQCQPPSVMGMLCEKSIIEVDMYHLYLTERNNGIDEYFEGIESMLTVENIRKHGRKIPKLDGYYKYRRLYSSYAGIGEVFAIIATFKNGSSAYVPAISYGFDMEHLMANLDSAFIFDSHYMKIVCTILPIFGLFICFIGHKFFKFSIFLSGYAFGAILTYIILERSCQLSFEENVNISLGLGLVYGSFWLFVWWKYGRPIVSVHMTFLLAGMILASIFSYSSLADYPIFRSDVNFWVCFICVMFAFCILWNTFPKIGYIFACSLLGSYLCICTLNYYMGSNLQYIIINTFRRATVPLFNLAVIDPPFQIYDVYQMLFWALLLFVGLFYQLISQNGRPPFPSPRYRHAIPTAPPSETTPLLEPVGDLRDVFLHPSYGRTIRVQ